MPTKNLALVILISTCLAQFFRPFMLAGVSSALPVIGTDTGASAQELSLIITFYALGLATFQINAGRMGDIWGRKKLFLWGMSIFAITALLIGLLQEILPILALRFLQGMSAATFTTTSLAILIVATPEEKRRSYLAYSTASVYAGIACGPPIAGLIASTIGWRWLFFAETIASGLVVIITYLAVKDEWYSGKGEPFDWKSSFLYSAAICLLTVGSTNLHNHTQLSIGGIILGIIFLLLFAMSSLRSTYPLLNLRIIGKNKVLLLSLFAAFINYSSTFGVTFFFSLYLQLIRGFSVADAGLFMAIQFAVQTTTTPFVGKLTEKYSPSSISSIGIALSGLGLCLAAFFHAQTPWALFITSQVMLGLGMSFFAAPNTAVIFESVEKDFVGQASSLVGTVRTAGALFNTIIISMTLGYFLGAEPVSQKNIELFLRSMNIDLIIFGLLSFMALSFSLLRLRTLNKNKN